MALFARICVRVHSRVPAPTFPPPLYTGGWKWAGVRLGGRVCVCVCVCVCVRVDVYPAAVYIPHPSPQPLPAAPPLDVEKCKIFDLRGLFLCGGKIYHPLPKNAGEGKRMGK